MSIYLQRHNISFVGYADTESGYFMGGKLWDKGPVGKYRRTLCLPESCTQNAPQVAGVTRILVGDNLNLPHP